MGIKRSRVVAKIFTLKFAKYWNHSIVNGFLDLITRSPSYNIEKGNFGDVCDFVLNVIEKHKKTKEAQPLFSFSKRTMFSIIALANEWHNYILQENEIQSALDRARSIADNRNDNNHSKGIKVDRWKGISVFSSKIEDDGCIWSFIQLCDVHSLVNEGRKMKSCISSYSMRCALGNSAIFHVSRLFKIDQSCENVATLEVVSGRKLVQAKGKCNTKLSPSVISVIRKWAQLNRIKFDLGL